MLERRAVCGEQAAGPGKEGKQPRLTAPNLSWASTAPLEESGFNFLVSVTTTTTRTRRSRRRRSGLKL